NPKHANETDEQQRRLQKPNSEVGGEFSEMPSVLMNSLIGVEPNFSYPDDPGCALLAHPVVDQVESCSLTQFHANGLVEPRLSHVQKQQDRSNLEEHQELIKKCIKLTVANGIVEGLVPRVEPDLHIDSRNDDEHQRHSQP